MESPGLMRSVIHGVAGRPEGGRFLVRRPLDSLDEGSEAARRKGVVDAWPFNFLTRAFHAGWEDGCFDGLVRTGGPR